MEQLLVQMAHTDWWQLDHSQDRFMDYLYKDTVHVPGSTTAATYDVRGAAVTISANNFQFNTSYGGGGRLSIMEIAQ